MLARVNRATAPSEFPVSLSLFEQIFLRKLRVWTAYKNNKPKPKFQIWVSRRGQKRFGHKGQVLCWRLAVTSRHPLIGWPWQSCTSDFRECCWHMGRYMYTLPLKSSFFFGCDKGREGRPAYALSSFGRIWGGSCSPNFVLQGADGLQVLQGGGGSSLNFVLQTKWRGNFALTVHCFLFYFSCLQELNLMFPAVVRNGISCFCHLPETFFPWHLLGTDFFPFCVGWSHKQNLFSSDILKFQETDVATESLPCSLGRRREWGISNRLPLV